MTPNLSPNAASASRQPSCVSPVPHTSNSYKVDFCDAIKKDGHVCGGRARADDEVNKSKCGKHRRCFATDCRRYTHKGQTLCDKCTTTLDLSDEQVYPLLDTIIAPAPASARPSLEATDCEATDCTQEAINIAQALTSFSTLEVNDIAHTIDDAGSNSRTVHPTAALSTPDLELSADVDKVAKILTEVDQALFKTLFEAIQRVLSTTSELAAQSPIMTVSSSHPNELFSLSAQPQPAGNKEVTGVHRSTKQRYPPTAEARDARPSNVT